MSTSPGPWHWIGDEDEWRLVDEQTADVAVAIASLHGEKVGIAVGEADRDLIAAAPELRDALAWALRVLAYSPGAVADRTDEHERHVAARALLARLPPVGT